MYVLISRRKFLIIGMQGRYNKTARILEMELKVAVKKTEIQDYLHWIVHMIEISAFSQSRCQIWAPIRLSEHTSSASFENFILTSVDIAEIS
jgi:hypothetical protein